MTEAMRAFHREFLQDVYCEAEAGEQFTEDAFFELFCGHLVEAGELDTADRAFFQAQRGVRIDGYGGDPASSDGVLSLIISDFSAEQEAETLTGTDMEATFKRATAFLSKSLDSSFRNGLEETSAGFGLADLISSCWNSINKVRIILISNRVLSARVDGREAGSVAGRPVVYSVWDLGRLYRYVSSGRSREELIIELGEHGGSLTALPAHLGGAGYEAYLIVMPGAQLASIYGKWGPRLLEQNVRVFLQARGGVNKGIRNTLDNDPEMFFAYNNGITATAEEVIGTRKDGTIVVSALKNLQIVNGGQTTGSIYAASQRSGVDLSRVFVQMKLSVIPHERAETVVPRISEYANSQNKVNAADFFANHPYHVRIKEFSGRVSAPSRDGSFRESKWFYERARGQYQDARGGLTKAEQRRFDLEFPKSQVFTKTDLAKFLLVWECLPHIVSRGAQKNFAQFAERIGRSWEANPDQYNESYFKHAIAKAIIFREAEALVSRQSWYEGGYRAQVVAHALAKMANDVEQLGFSVDFDSIWKRQQVSGAMQDAIVTVGERVMEVVSRPPTGAVKNVTEWAKQPACWSRVQALTVVWPAAWVEELMTREEHASRSRGAVKEQKMLNGIEAQTAVVNAGPEIWMEVKAWGAARRLLSEKDLGLLDAAIGMNRKLPSEKQCVALVTILRRLRTEGCQLASDIR